MKTKSIYLENKGFTINEFRNLILQELKKRKIYGLKTIARKFTLKLKYEDNFVMIPYRTLEMKKSIKEIVDYYEEDIKDLF